MSSTYVSLCKEAIKIDSSFCDGYLTALPVLKILASDLSAYIPVKVIIIPPEQIFMEIVILPCH